MRRCAMAFSSVVRTCSCPISSANACGLYFLAMTWYMDEYGGGSRCPATIHASTQASWLLFGSGEQPSRRGSAEKVLVVFRSEYAKTGGRRNLIYLTLFHGWRLHRNNIMKNQLSILILAAFFSAAAFSATPMVRYGDLPLSFEENRGQTNAQV